MSEYSRLNKLNKKQVDNAINILTFEDVQNITFGEDIEISDNVVLSHYCEEDIITLNLLDSWTEVYQVMTDNKKIILETI